MHGALNHPDWLNQSPLLIKEGSVRSLLTFEAEVICLSGGRGML